MREKSHRCFYPHQRAGCLDAPDGKPVSLIFILLVPENATGEHLEVLSKLAGRFSQKAIREALMAATSAEEVRTLLTEE